MGRMYKTYFHSNHSLALVLHLYPFARYGKGYRKLPPRGPKYRPKYLVGQAICRLLTTIAVGLIFYGTAISGSEFSHVTLVGSPNSKGATQSIDWRGLPVHRSTATLLDLFLSAQRAGRDPGFSPEIAAAMLDPKQWSRIRDDIGAVAGTAFYDLSTTHPQSSELSGKLENILLLSAVDKMLESFENAEANLELSSPEARAELSAILSEPHPP